MAVNQAACHQHRHRAGRFYCSTGSAAAPRRKVLNWPMLLSTLSDYRRDYFLLKLGVCATASAGWQQYGGEEGVSLFSDRHF